MQIGDKIVCMRNNADLNKRLVIKIGYECTILDIDDNDIYDLLIMNDNGIPCWVCSDDYALVLNDDVNWKSIAEDLLDRMGYTLEEYLEEKEANEEDKFIKDLCYEYMEKEDVDTYTTSIYDVTKFIVEKFNLK